MVYTIYERRQQEILKNRSPLLYTLQCTKDSTPELKPKNMVMEKNVQKIASFSIYLIMK